MCPESRAPSGRYDPWTRPIPLKSCPAAARGQRLQVAWQGPAKRPAALATPCHPAGSPWQGLAAGGRSLGEALPRAAPRPVPPTTSRLLRLGNTSDLAICMFAELGCRSSAVSVYYLVGRKVPPSAQVVGSLRNGRRRKATKKTNFDPALCLSDGQMELNTRPTESCG